MALGPAELAHGPMLVGTFLSLMLYGISITQVYIYLTSYAKKDRRFIMAYVLLIFAADTGHSIFLMGYLYTSLIKHFDDPEYISHSTWVFAAEPALAGILCGLVQAFYAWRVNVLVGKWYIYLTILFCSVASILMGIATGIACQWVVLFSNFQKFEVVVIVWLVSASVADCLITGSLVNHLRHHRTGFQKTDTHIDRIIRLTVQTGMITAIWAVADLLVYLLNPTGMHLVLNCPLGKLYANSLLSSLNSRGGWKFMESQAPTNDRSGEYTEHGTRNRQVEVNLSTNRPQVFIEVESHEMTDPSSQKTNMFGP
ncbi:hypothetical protein GYMLUDRAFT_45033 [Collybiopsis luxurians FD-317 M1]|uniref:DUF6534 domain-containing protein n=1 Tax=Collybiopsis luxurians FD-317 M1 TaxID=944289 RepID=A0A0D0CTI0_9AGAR|nr:hypothetical protein GYMLUDRAFT_45033 [Collybiopsis luxurians FD-317 M1]